MPTHLLQWYLPIQPNKMPILIIELSQCSGKSQHFVLWFLNIRLYLYITRTVNLILKSGRDSNYILDSIYTSFWILAIILTSRVTLDKLKNLSIVQFPHLRGDKSFYLTVLLRGSADLVHSIHVECWQAENKDSIDGNCS